MIDATRVLTGGGPTGGSLDLVRNDDLIAVATDPVAADAWGATLLDFTPAELPTSRSPRDSGSAPPTGSRWRPRSDR